MNIAVTGYCGTGSSAVNDLLKEYKSCSNGLLENYEHIPLYTPNGLFDLEDKLLIGNNLHRSDEALESFYNEMKRLNDNNFGWFGGYKKHFGNEFMRNVDGFINEIAEFEFPGKWSYTAKKMRLSPVQFAVDILRIFMGRKTYRNFGEKEIDSRKKNIRYAFVDEKKFYASAQKFIQKYFKMTQAKTENTVYDHLVLPHNLWRIPEYFDDDFRVIVVDRDVRDLFVLGKYVWPSLGSYAPFPREVKKFISFWKKMRACEKKIDDPRILRINFEDIVYDYENTVRIIENFLNLNPSDHIMKKRYFVPEKSIKNTQNFNIKTKWIREVQQIDRMLPQYVYTFPYRIQTSIKETFD